MLDMDSGECKATGATPEERDLVAADHCCEKWEDAGQQYYIRLGWIKGQKKKEESLN